MQITKIPIKPLVGKTESKEIIVTCTASKNNNVNVFY